MATAEQYAQWIVSNQDKQGTPEFETVAKAYKIARGGQVELAEPEKPTLPVEESIVPTDEALAANQAPKLEEKGFLEDIGEKAAGVSEAALTAVTAPFGALASGIGTLDMILNQIKSGEIGSQEAADKVKAEAERLAAEYTYAPRTETGREIVETIGEVTEPLIAVAPQLQQVGMATRGAGVGAKMVAQEIPKELQPAATALKAALDKRKTTEGTGRAAGAEAVDQAVVRQMQAKELPVPIEMTKGQATREFAQQQFEREIAKQPELGDPIRKRFIEHNEQVQQNLDAFIDQTGADVTSLRDVGVSVTKAINKELAKRKTKIRAMYKKAEQSGGMAENVDLQPLSDFMNKSRAEAEAAPVLKALNKEIVEVRELGSGSVSDGSLSIGKLSLNDAESIRRRVNGLVKSKEPEDVRMATILKKIIDEQTEGKGNELYKAARKERMKLANDFGNVGTVKNLIETKPGTKDRRIALEDVLRKSVIDPSASTDQVVHLRRLLKREGAEGQQAWRDVQGGVIQYIKDEITKNVAMDELGNPVVSPATFDKIITRLGSTEKLEAVFGKAGAEKLELLRDVTKDLMVAPPGSVNTSGTSAAILAAIDMMVTAGTGMPTPVLSGLRLLSKNIKDRKIKKRVNEALKGVKTPKDQDK